MNIPGVEGLVDPKAALQQAAGEQIGQAAQGVTQVAQVAQDPAAAVSNLAGNQLGELASNAVSIPVDAPAALDAVSLPPGDVSGAMSNTAQGLAGNSATNLQNTVGVAVDNAASNLQGAVSNAASAAENAASDALSGAQNAVSGVKDAAAEKIAKAKEAGGDLFDTPFDEMFSSADASPFSQENRLIKLQLGDGEDLGLQLLPQSVTGDEAINTPYRYTVLCDSPDDAIDLRKLIGIIAQLDILTGEGGIKNLALSASSGADEKNVVRTGIITKAESLPSDGGFAKYRLTIEPGLALLRQRFTARVFQDKNVPQDHPDHHRRTPRRQHPVRQNLHPALRSAERSRLPAALLLSAIPRNRFRLHRTAAGRRRPRLQLRAQRRRQRRPRSGRRQTGAGGDGGLRRSQLPAASHARRNPLSP